MIVNEGAYVIRLYITKRQVFTNQTVRICICSTTKTSLEPKTRSLISCAENLETSSPGAMRLLLLLMIKCITAITTVSVDLCARQHSLLQAFLDRLTIATIIK